LKTLRVVVSLGLVGNLYFLRQNAGNVFKTPPEDGAALAVAAASGYELVAQDGTYLYLLQGGCCTSSILKLMK
jgi:hypothetical protein